MSGYEVEHNIKVDERRHPRRPDLSTFWSNVNELDTTQNNTTTTGHPAQISAIYRILANAVQIQGGITEGVYSRFGGSDAGNTGQTGLIPTHPQANADDLGQASLSLVHSTHAYILSTLMANADDPPVQVQGVPQVFLDGLDRVTKNELKKLHSSGKDVCPICAVSFLEDQYPLVVRLPCHHDHVFDLECIAPWLKINITCPMCRKEVVKRDRPDASLMLNINNGTPTALPDEEDDGDIDGLYG